MMNKIDIIIVDDHVLFSQALNGLVSNFDEFNVVTVLNNGKELVDYFSKENKQPQIVLMDIKMPIMNGIEATIEIRKMELAKGWQRIKIIAVTAFAMPGDEEKFKEVGIDLYISKPYTSAQLISFIEL